MVGIGNLAGIEIVGILRGEGFRRDVGIMGVEVMQKEKEGFIGVLLEIGACETRGLFSASLQRIVRPNRLDKLVVVGVETLMSAKLFVEDERTYYGGGGISAGSKNLGDGRIEFGKYISQIVVYTVVEGVGAGEHRAVGRKSKGNGCKGILEDDTLFGDGIDIGSGFTSKAIAAEVIRPAGIDADEDDAARPFW